MGDRLKKALTRKLGPLPAWAWALIAGAGVWYYRRKLSNAAGDTSQSGQAADTAYYGPYGQDPYGIGGGAGNAGSGGFGSNGTASTLPADISGMTDPLAPPTINVTTGGGRHRRTRKHKPHHNRQHKHGNQHRKRSHAHTHENHHAVHHTGQHHHRRRRHR